jgi:hypothetical protein
MADKDRNDAKTYRASAGRSSDYVLPESPDAWGHALTWILETAGMRGVLVR